MSEKVLFVDWHTGRNVISEKLFEWKHLDNFDAYAEACNWLRENGYSYWSMARNSPIGIVKEKDAYIAKWYNIDRQEYQFLDWIIIGTNYRDDDVRILFFN